MKEDEIIVSQFDREAYTQIRENIRLFLRGCAERYDAPVNLLDIAPQVHEGAAAYFREANVETIGIDPDAGTTYTGDITRYNESIMDGKYDIIVCTEVLEHVKNPFSAVKEIKRIVKDKGIIIATVPFNFRIHGPLPDCWRFTEHGLKVLFEDFSEVSIKELKTADRDLMPIHYTILAKK